jgi:hypothetical protein
LVGSIAVAEWSGVELHMELQLKIGLERPMEDQPGINDKILQ